MNKMIELSGRVFHITIGFFMLACLAVYRGWNVLTYKARVSMILELIALVMVTMTFGFWGFIGYYLVAKIVFIYGFWNKGFDLKEVYSVHFWEE